jgi:DNA-binding MarR family transcriptional regulator
MNRREIETGYTPFQESAWDFCRIAASHRATACTAAVPNAGYAPHFGSIGATGSRCLQKAGPSARMPFFQRPRRRRGNEMPSRPTALPGNIKNGLEQARRRSALLVRPGFLIRRLHQIHTALFMEETEAFNITPVQYSLMTALHEHGELDQTSLSAEIGLERTNVADVIARLQARGLLVRRPGDADRRVKLLKLTIKGHNLVRRMAGAVQRAHDRTIDHLSEPERDILMTQLIRLVDANNHQGAAPLRLDAAVEA